MKTLFLDRKNSEIEISGRRLLVRTGDSKAHFSVPLRQIEQLVISAPVTFSSTLLMSLTYEGINIVFLNQRNKGLCAINQAMMHNDTSRRLLQYHCVTNEAIRFSFSNRLVIDKLRAQRILLKKALRKRPDCRHALSKAIAVIDNILLQLPSCASIESLRGYEGAAAAAYFQAYRSLFAPALAFNERNRRPPKDPVNVILSLSYTLLYAEATRTLFATGFDPMLGVYHEAAFGRESLSCDLVELFRPLMDRWVWCLFSGGQLRADHFKQVEGQTDRPCILGKRGREVYYINFARKAPVWRLLMRRVARNWLEEIRTCH
ncbi:MAG: CRISPR-associated endonuclease Cas1, partial [Pseudomonadales bacterium]|nr:CRISPR-associated endonuclease Cas1 [Pseudomonadales bacterium]